MKFTKVCLFSALLAATVVGCGPAAAPPTKASEAAFKGSTDNDKTKAAEFLQKAGIDGEIVSMINGEKEYMVDVAKKMVPGKRSSPQPPTTYKIDKASGKVTKEM
jgi:hypothetical protein